MHRIFQPLDRRRVSLLLTLMMQGGQEALPMLDLLPQEDAQPIKEKAALLAQIPGDKRALFIAHEFKGMMSDTSARGFEYIDPSWIVEALQKESPRIVASILVGLPGHQLKTVVEKLPASVRKKLPAKQEMSTLPAEVVRSMRLIFEQRFVTMPPPPQKNFSFREIISLDTRELLLLLRSLGLEELAQAFVSVGRYALAQLCKNLPRDYATELISAVKETKAQDAMDLKSAQRFLARVLVNYSDAEELSGKAGLYRFSKALAGESEDYIAAFYQRLPKPLAEELEGYLAKVGELGETDADRAKRLQDAILRRVSSLAQKKEIMPRYNDFQFQFHEVQA